MKRGIDFASHAALAAGLGLVGFALYASFMHQMSWLKLVLFWIGAGALAFFLLHRIFARIDTFRAAGKVRRYKTGYRILCAAILPVGLIAVAFFTQHTLQSWEQPAAYWEFAGETPGPPNHHQTRWLLGNQRYEQTLRLLEVQLIELGSAALHESGGAMEIACALDSQPLAVVPGDGNIRRFRVPGDFTIPPLHTATMQLDIRFRHRFALYALAAIYQTSAAAGNHEQKTSAAKTLTLERYFLVQPPHAELIDFEQLARLAQRPSWHTREAVIAALGRSRHPQAWQALQDLLKVNDPRVQGAVCQAMTYLGDARATAALMQLVKRSKNPQAVRALATIAAPEGIDFLLELLNDPKEESYLRIAAAGMMGEMKLRAAAPALAALVKDKNEHADFALKREALSALARLDQELATQTAIAAVQGSPDPRQIRTCLETVSELEHEKMLPLLAEWLANWRRYDLDADDVETMLSYIVAGGHHDMVEVMMEGLLHEPAAEVQGKFVAALTALSGNDFGHIEVPEIGHAAQESNRRVINSWNRWWGRARNEAIYAEQVSPAPGGNKI